MAAQEEEALMGLMAESWASFEKAVMPANVHPVQRIEMQRAFYAGAQGLLGSLLEMFESDREPTVADLRLVDDVVKELDAFQDGVAKGRA